MCTAITLKTEDFYFGRTLDNEYSYFEEITVTPRNYPFYFRNTEPINSHYAIIGMAFNKDNFPLYYDASNEKGLSMAGLSFVGNAHYNAPKSGVENVAQFELIPFILGKCATVNEAVMKIKNINITNTDFSEDLPSAQLHWIIADEERAVTLECTQKGMKIYENPVGVLTNNPEFPEQLNRLNDYMHLSSKNHENTFCSELDLQCYSKGMGAIGLPGDLSSVSRFIRASFVKCNSASGTGEGESVNQFFHIIGDVEQTRGANITKDGYETSIYTSCCNATKGIYYYKTYENSRVCAVDMHRCDLQADVITKFPLRKEPDFLLQN